MTDTTTLDAPTPKAMPRRRGIVSSGHRRDADAARAAAKARLALAGSIATAVDAYHVAADRIDAATAELTAASDERLTAIRKLRSCKLTIAEIGDLTGLSASRVQALSRDHTD